MDKLQMAHEWALVFMQHNKDLSVAAKTVSAWAFDYADAMQAEADKRINKERPEVLKEEWQPDWGQAPDNAKYWAMDGCGQCNWYAIKPEVCGNQWDFGRVIEQAHTGYGYQGNWKESLRERPQ